MIAAGDQGNVVVIDDDSAIRLACRKILAKDGYQVETFADGVHGLESIARLKPDVVVVDLKMPGISGMEVISRVHEIDPEVIIVVITGYATIDTAVEAMKSGAYDFLPKPFSPDPLRLIVRRGMERRRLAIESHRHEVERELLKRRFVTFVSHQLQTPLVAIHQYLDVLQHLADTPETTAKRKEWMGRCLKRIEELQAMIRDWLTLAKAEDDSLITRRVSVDLKPVILSILSTYEKMASEDGISFETSLPEAAYPVWGSRNCLNVLFDNLIANAIKYNRPGGKVTVTGEFLDDGEIAVSVTDTGVGVPEKYRRFLFEEFFRIPQKGTRSGTGLGLAICRKIVSEMGGTIDVQSEVDVGTTFRVRLLAHSAPASQEARTAERVG